MITTGQWRFVAEITRAMGEFRRIGGLDKAQLRMIGSEYLPNQKKASVERNFVKPAWAIIRHENGERQERSSRKSASPRALTIDEVLRLLDVAANHPEIVRVDPKRRMLQKIAFQLGGGAGPGETCAITMADIDVQNQRAYIAGREPGARKNEYRRRYVYLPSYYWDLLGEFPADGKAFLSPQGKPYAPRLYRGGQYTTAFKSVVRAAGLPDEITPYNLRKTWASHFYAATRNLKALTLLGGWADGDLPLKTYVELLPAGTAEELLKASIDYGQVLDNLDLRDV